MLIFQGNNLYECQGLLVGCQIQSRELRSDKIEAGGERSTDNEQSFKIRGGRFVLKLLVDA